MDTAGVLMAFYKDATAGVDFIIQIVFASSRWFSLPIIFLFDRNQRSRRSGRRRKRQHVTARRRRTISIIILRADAEEVHVPIRLIHWST